MEKYLVNKSEKPVVYDLQDVFAFNDTGGLVSIDGFGPLSELSKEQVKAFKVTALEDRLSYTKSQFEYLWSKNPRNAKAENPFTTTEFNDAKRELNEYRDNTARLLALIVKEHPEYIDLKEWESGDGKLGEAVSTTGYPDNTREWHLARVDTIGGSDFGMIVKHWFEKTSINSVEKSKTSIPDYVKDMPSAFDEKEELQDEDGAPRGTTRKGPLFRGSTWEDAIVRGFSEDYRNKYAVSITKNQYINDEYSWMKINVDGVITDTNEDSGNYQEHGILEIKNISEYDLDKLAVIKSSRDSDTGFADNKYLKPEYLAQVLYYLKGTGFKYAVARKQFNDTEPVDFYISADDDVYLGSGVKVEPFIQEVVEPLYRKWKKQRELSGLNPSDFS